MGKTAAEYLKTRKDRTHLPSQETTQEARLTDETRRLVEEWRESYRKTVEAGFVPVGRLMQIGVDVSGCPLKKLEVPKGYRYNDPLAPQEDTWLPAWAAAIALVYSGVGLRRRLVQRAVDDPARQLFHCGYALLRIPEAMLHSEVRRALAIWIARLRNEEPDRA